MREKQLINKATAIAAISLLLTSLAHGQSYQVKVGQTTETSKLVVDGITYQTDGAIPNSPAAIGQTASIDYPTGPVVIARATVTPAAENSAPVEAEAKEDFRFIILSKQEYAANPDTHPWSMVTLDHAYDTTELARMVANVNYTVTGAGATTYGTVVLFGPDGYGQRLATGGSTDSDASEATFNNYVELATNTVYDYVLYADAKVAPQCYEQQGCLAGHADITVDPIVDLGTDADDWVVVELPMAGAVPEPATAGLMITALIAMFGASRRRRAARDIQPAQLASVYSA